MQAIQTTGNIDNKGFLHLKKPLNERQKEVKVIILFEKDSHNDTQKVKNGKAVLSTHPTYDFLNVKDENTFNLKVRNKMNDFLEICGIWEGRNIDKETLRTNAWRQQKW